MLPPFSFETNGSTADKVTFFGSADKVSFRYRLILQAAGGLPPDVQYPC